jgi:hypothetical protein
MRLPNSRLVPRWVESGGRGASMKFGPRDAGEVVDVGEETYLRFAS